PDVMLGLYDYTATSAHPAFNLALRVNFVDGAGETSGFRFIGSEGIMKIDGGVTPDKQQREPEPGYTIQTFAKATQETCMEARRERPQVTEPRVAPALAAEHHPPDTLSGQHEGRERASRLRAAYMCPVRPCCRQAACQRAARRSAGGRSQVRRSAAGDLAQG